MVNEPSSLADPEQQLASNMAEQHLAVEIVDNIEL